MADQTDYFVNPSTGTDDTAAGRGDSAGDPWASVQFALNTITASADGDRVNLADASADTLSSALDVTGGYGTPTETAPLTIQGYTSAAADGGRGEINCGGSNGLFLQTTIDNIGLKDLLVHNAGSAAVIQADDHMDLQNVEVHNSTGHGIQLGSECSVVGCYVHNVGGDGITTAADAYIVHNFIKNETNDVVNAIEISGGLIAHNIISIDGSSHGIFLGNDAYVYCNSVWSNGGTGLGIGATSGSTRNLYAVKYNIVEGFSGSGGRGYENSPAHVWKVMGGNYAFNNSTEYDIQGEHKILVAANSTLLATPFEDAANDDFRLKSGVDPIAGAFFTSFLGASTTQSFDAGAAQSAPGGGGSVTAVDVHNVMNFGRVHAVPY